MLLITRIPVSQYVCTIIYSRDFVYETLLKKDLSKIFDFIEILRHM